ncbi:hypothetical protein Adu01nite_51220 [Paractinoplanes durhamensis]|uniref:Galactose oxidase n=1 Tax=Paractinoplanes durhamensis TaxID=113563 RepID=A0ABQ3Z1Q7_9ACTN|nr:hypothetical protein Adu01nite_51220 [Actinoplanes durhamensis]
MGRFAMAGASLIAVAAGAAVLATKVTKSAPPPWTAAVEKLPAAPLAARRDVSGVWTGSELLVWGGFAGNQAHEKFFADGAAYRPGTRSWRKLPAAPLGARSEAQAVWTGTEMIVWGGSDARHSQFGVVDGAAYNPRTDKWRRIAAAPGRGRTGGQALMAGGKMVVFGGNGVLGADMSKTTLVYDPRADAWTTFPTPGRVFAAAPSGDTLVLAEYADDGRLAVTQVGLDGSELARTPAPVGDKAVERVGLAAAGGKVYLALTDQAPETWVAVGTLSDGVLLPGWAPVTTSHAAPAPNEISTGYTGLTALLSPDLLLLAGLPDVTMLDPRSGRVQLSESTYQEAGFCGVSGAVVWTGAQLLSWGGQTCRPEGPPVTADGLSLTVAALPAPSRG